MISKYLTKKKIAKTFNEFFISIGSNLAAALDFTGTSLINSPMNQNLFTEKVEVHFE